MPGPHELQEIIHRQLVALIEYATPHDVEQGVGEVPAGDQLVGTGLEPVGAAYQLAQPPGPGIDVALDGVHGHAVAHGFQQIGCRGGALPNVGNDMP